MKLLDVIPGIRLSSYCTLHAVSLYSRLLANQRAAHVGSLSVSEVSFLELRWKSVYELMLSLHLLELLDLPPGPLGTFVVSSCYDLAVPDSLFMISQPRQEY